MVHNTIICSNTDTYAIICRSKCLPPSEVFQKNYTNLVKLLPMKDELFIAELFTRNLLPGNLKETLHSIPVSTARASVFLDTAIKPTVSTNDSTKFNILLEVMKNCDDETVKKLGESISSMLNEKSGKTFLKLCYAIFYLILKIQWMSVVVVILIMA